jgi:nickel/cobalt exporter
VSWGRCTGLNPGHSKTMMAAFIIVIRGTVSQAVLLGLCAAGHRMRRAC